MPTSSSPPCRYSVLTQIIHSILACALSFLKGLNYSPIASKVLSTYCQFLRQERTETVPATEQQQRMMLKKDRPSSSPTQLQMKKRRSAFPP